VTVGVGMTKRSWALGVLALVWSSIVALLCVIRAFPEACWLLVVLVPAAAAIVIRRDARRRAELAVLKKLLLRRKRSNDVVQQRVLVFIDSVGLAELEALRYARGLPRDRLTAVHFVIDESHAARLQVHWPRFGHDVDLRMVDCEDRNLGRAAHDLVAQVKNDYPGSTVTVLLPRRMYSPLAGRLLHDRTADTMARMISRIPDVSAQILVCDVKSRVAQASGAADGEAPGRPAGQPGKPQATTPVN
jgi:hypothetical protein